MTEDESLAQFGLTPKCTDLPAIRELLVSQITAAVEDEDDSGLMKLCCIQLFSLGEVSDVMLIWSAKRSSFDNGLNIDVQLLCGAGLEMTKQHLAGMHSVEAAEALQYITECEEGRDFEEFEVTEVINYYRQYYGL